MTSLQLAALGWWQGKRPVDWHVEQHLQNSTVNCATTREAKLARQVGKMVARLRARRKR